MIKTSSQKYRLFETRLQKTTFLAELNSWENKCGGLDYAFIKFNHGPYSNELRGDVGRLQKVNLVHKTRVGFSLGPEGFRFMRRNEEMFERNSQILDIVDKYAEIVMEPEFQEMLDEVYAMPNPIRPNITIGETRHKAYLLSREVRPSISNPFNISKAEIETFEILFDPELLKLYKEAENSVRTQPYIIIQSETFSKQKKRAFKRDQTLKRRTKKIIEDLKLNPYRKSTKLVDSLRGKRRIHIGPKKAIIYAICEECRKLEEEKFNACFECDEKEDNTVLLMVLIKRKHDYKR
jgi:mRNA-degrading endonuclease YafQ of YafQ-DinJ toxin-antitoxin module